ncbi:MAG TPA: hypothetical protein VK539_34345 [Myxococcaceae bacterium]|nr:hypothetical protein [Myxococcaceae bacterium]
MTRAHLLLLSLLVSPGAVLAQEAPPAAAPAQPKPPETAPAAATTPPPAPREEDKPQAKPQMETLLSGDVTQGGFGGPVLAYSRVLDRDVLFFGGRGGWIANHRFVLGAGGFAMTTKLAAPSGAPLGGENLRLDFGYGGLWLEYILWPHKLLHVTAGTLVGGGAAIYNRTVRADGEDRELISDIVVVVDPVLSAELNVLRFLRLSAGVGYRYVGSVNLAGLEKDDLSGFTVSVMIRFGNF